MSPTAKQTFCAAHKHMSGLSDAQARLLLPLCALLTIGA